jgi:nuclear transport factor 2 (NTF2) superfamily protein
MRNPRGHDHEEHAECLLQDVCALCPPWTEFTASQKVRGAEDLWNTRNAVKTAGAYTSDSTWRNRDLFLSGTDELVNFLENKWAKEQEYRLVKEMFAFTDYRIAVRFVYEWHDAEGQWWRSFGNENWEYDECSEGKMRKRIASINDIKIDETDRKLLWERGDNPEGNQRPGGKFTRLSDLGF